MREIGLMFTGESMRGIIEGRKTQTRRVVQPQPPAELAKAPLEQLLEEGWFQRTPYGAAGDTLWCKETWGHADDHVGPHSPACCWYRAEPCKRGFPGHVCEHGPDTWRLAMFMPRWAARVTLQVVSTRIERLQELSEEDALAEGCAAWPVTARDAYQEAWGGINDKRGFAWSSNPWVHVIAFRVKDKL
jgi:hypothetical protein